MRLAEAERVHHLRATGREGEGHRRSLRRRVRCSSYLKAFDAKTGKEEWTTYSIPGPGEPGNETWPQDGKWKNAWKTGGGTMWMPGNYDAKNDIIYWGVGNGSPWPGDQRPGDNLYLASVISINPDNGKILGHYQYHWNDSWDWAGMNAPSLVNFEKDGKEVPGLITAQRNGVLYWLDRNDKGEITYDASKQYVKNNVFTGFDPKTGRPTYNEDHKLGTGKKVTYCPSVWGGKDWFYQAYSPKTGTLYVPFNDNHCTTLEGVVQPVLPGQWSAGIDIKSLRPDITEGAPYIGGIQAWSVNGRDELWKTTYEKSWNFGSILATAGDVIFAGGTNDRKFRLTMPRAANFSGSFPRPPASFRRPLATRSTANNTSPSFPAMASTSIGSRARCTSPTGGRRRSPKADPCGCSRSVTRTSVLLPNELR